VSAAIITTNLYTINSDSSEIFPRCWMFLQIDDLARLQHM